MRISMYNNIDLHWWGNDLLLIRNIGEYYIFEEEEVFFVEHLCKTNKVADLVYNITRELDVDSITVESFIDIFMENFADYFYFTHEETTQLIGISGKRSAYYPLEIHISLTNRCVQNCKHCYKSAGAYGVFINSHMLAAFLDHMAGYVPYICLSGGEPTLHPDFSKIMGRYSSTYDICVLSSGVRVLPLLGVIAKAKRGMIVSIYSSIPSVHDEFAGYKGSYAEVLKSIDAAKANDIPVSITTLISKDNFKDIERLVELMNQKEIGIINIGRISSIGRAKESNLEAMKSIPDSLQEDLLGLKTRHSNVEILSDTVCGNALLPFSPLKCSAGTLSWSINEYGQIHPCGVCSVEELSLGVIDGFDESILINRTPYIEKVNKVHLIKHMQETGAVCPFHE